MLHASFVPEVVRRYFDAAARRDGEAVLALFTHDAVVLDEDQVWRGSSEIRDWWNGPATAFQYTTQVRGVGPATGSDLVVHVHLDGNFPGGSVDLTYRFSIDGDHISRLESTPEGP